MYIIPAIDLINGKCVRLLKGEEGTETVFSSNPVAVAKKWESCGAQWIHIVDLDGAFEGKPKNFKIIENIVNTVSCSVQVGGGIRDFNTIKNYLEAGVKRLILGTSVFKDPEFFLDASSKYSEYIAVGLDTRDGKIAIKGWKETVDVDSGKLLNDFHEQGIKLLVHTDINKDGTMEGIDLRSVRSFVSITPIPFIVSGGISTTEDIEKIASLKSNKIYGVILGKSLYTKSINLEATIKRFSK